MKKILLFIALTLSVLVQGAPVRHPYRKQMAAGNYEQAERNLKTWHKLMKKNAMWSYAEAALYSHPDWKKHSYAEAYDRICYTDSLYKTLKDSKRKSVNRRGLIPAAIDLKRDQISSLALDEAIGKGSVKAIKKWLRTYTEASDSIQARAHKSLHAAAWEEADKEGTIAAYQQFISSYPDAEQVAQAEEKIEELIWLESLTGNTIEGYKAFINQYPTNKYVPLAWQRIYELAWQKAQEQDTEQAYLEMAKSYPDSPYAKEALLRAARAEYARLCPNHSWEELTAYTKRYERDSLRLTLSNDDMRRLLDGSRNICDLNYGLGHTNGQAQQDLAMQLHRLYERMSTLNGIEELVTLYSHVLPEQVLQKDNATLTQYALYQQDTDNASQFIKTAAPYYVAYIALTEQLKEALDTKDWERALALVNRYSNVFGNDPAYLDLKKTLEAESIDVHLTKLPDEINADGFDEYSPVLSADGKTLYYAAAHHIDGVGGEDIYISQKKTNKDWNVGESMKAFNTIGNETPKAISTDGTQMILFRNGKLLTSSKTAHGWSEPTPMSDSINTSTWQSDAVITSDGKALLFAARKIVDYEIDPSINIFVSLKNANGEWGTPTDLGPTINTDGVERSPYMHPDMKTLYFSSDSHSSIGGLDVFVSERLDENSWTEWSEPRNLGKDINSTGYDWGYKISTDGYMAFFASEDQSGKDIYSLILPPHMRPYPVATVSGTVYGNDKKGVSVSIRWENLDTQETVGESQSDPQDGYYFIVLPEGKLYGYYIDDERYYPTSHNIDLRNLNEMKQVVQDIELISYEDMIRLGIPAPLNNLFFEVNKYDLLPQSLPELKRVADIIKRLGVKVQVSGHTDNTGSDALNQTLSENRAMTVKDYFISQGINEEMIETVGYGPSRPKASNSTEEGRRTNRRVEVRFIK